MVSHVLLTFLIFFCVFASISGSSDQGRYKVLEMDTKGDLYLYKSSLMCTKEIIKRLTGGTYQLAEPSILGQSKEFAVLNCQDLKLKVPSATSGVYWIDPDGGSHGNAFQAYCDQQTDGGGWTLVWSYTFTAYSTFHTRPNAVTPRPTWTPNKGNTRVSTTAPLSETHYEAMNFDLWRTIGNQTLIKSNINNWIVCREDTGSIVREKAGSMKCKLVKQVSEQCGGVVPKSLEMTTIGLLLKSTSTYYYFDSSTVSHMPTHDPCGKNQDNQLKGVANPHGNIFIR